jgi:hypothetical protein
MFQVRVSFTPFANETDFLCFMLAKTSSGTHGLSAASSLSTFLSAHTFTHTHPTGPLVFENLVRIRGFVLILLVTAFRGAVALKRWAAGGGGGFTRGSVSSSGPLGVSLLVYAQTIALPLRLVSLRNSAPLLRRAGRAPVVVLSLRSSSHRESSFAFRLRKPYLPQALTRRYHYDSTLSLKSLTVADDTSSACGRGLLVRRFSLDELRHTAGLCFRDRWALQRLVLPSHSASRTRRFHATLDAAYWFSGVVQTVFTDWLSVPLSIQRNNMRPPGDALFIDSVHLVHLAYRCLAGQLLTENRLPTSAVCHLLFCAHRTLAYDGCAGVVRMGLVFDAAAAHCGACTGVKTI